MKNVADREQVKEAGKREKWKYRQDKDDLLHLLQQKQFRRYVWRWLEYTKVFSSIWRCSAEIHRLAGRQEMGQDMMVEVTQADPDAFLKMMKENQKPEDNPNDN